MRLILIIIASLGCAASRHVRDKFIRTWINTLSVSWVGVLSYKETNNSKEAIAGIILIDTKLAIGNAYEVSNINKKHIRKTTKVMFLTEDGVVNSTVTDYILHPEFDEDTLNTIALIKLEYNETEFRRQLMDWPSDYSQMDKHVGEIYLLGFTDRHKTLAQVMHRMEFVNSSYCHAFYKNEQLDSKWMAPTEFQCFKRKYSNEQCVIDSGMALAVHYKGKWTLLGMSVLGPGCALPSRFLDFARFVPWVTASGHSTRRHMPFLKESNIHWPNYDKVILEKLYDDSIVMRPYRGQEVIYGNCSKIDGSLMYNEEGKFVVPDYGIAIYGLSIWDKMYLNITCVLLTVECDQRSVRPFSFDFGLLQYNEDLKDMTRVVPIKKYSWTDYTGSNILHLKHGPWLNWFYRPRDNANVSSVVFKFKFYKEAKIKLLFYGIEVPIPVELEPPVPTKADDEKRSRRPNSYHLRTTPAI